LLAYTHAVEELVHDLRAELRSFDAYTGWLSGFDDPLSEMAFELDDLASWVAHVAWAFATAGAAGDLMTDRVVAVDANAVDFVLGRADWHPSSHLRAGANGEWLRAVEPQCGVFAGAGYRGSGFLVGRDGRSYPLVAPYVERGGVRYDADDGVEPGATSVDDLDGRDPGWTTIDEVIGVERWRDVGSFDRVMAGVGSTVAGRPFGSSERDVAELVIRPGMAPYFTDALDRPPPEPAPPAYLSPYPSHSRASGVADSLSIAVDGLGGAIDADQGSFAAFDVAFQVNADGRTRALYKRVYVGFDDDGTARPQSVWVTGPETNDHTAINYAP